MKDKLQAKKQSCYDHSLYNPEFQAKDSPATDTRLPIGTGIRSINNERLPATVRWGIWIFIVSLTVRLALVIILAPYKFPIWSEVQRIPLNLVKTGLYGDPFGYPTGPTAHYMPLYPLLLAGVFKIFGTHVTGEIAQYVFNIAITSLMYSVLPALAYKVGLPLRAGIIAGAIGALTPFEFLQEIRGGDMSLTALFFVAFVGVLFGAVKGDLRIKRALLAGAVLGFGALTNPSILAPAVALLLLLVAANRRRLRQVVRFALIVGAICVALLTPWAVRNYFALGYPVPLRSNLGIELQVSNNDFADPRFEDAPLSAAMRLYHPVANPQETKKIRTMGEVAYNREKLAEYKQWSMQNPERFCELLGARFVLFWFPITHHTGETIYLFAVTVVALAGMIVLRWQNRDAFWIVLAIWLTYPDLYYLIQAWHRYRMPIEWSYLLCAGVFLSYLTDRLHNSVRRA